MKKSLQRQQTSERSEQKILVDEDGNIVVDWINPDHSAVVQTVMSVEDRERYEDDDKIWCG